MSRTRSISDPQLRADVVRMCDIWREKVGRLPRAVEHDLPRAIRQHGSERTWAAMDSVIAADFRRTEDRLRLFYAALGEVWP